MPSCGTGRDRSIPTPLWSLIPSLQQAARYGGALCKSKGRDAVRDVNVVDQQNIRGPAEPEEVAATVAAAVPASDSKDLS